MFHIVPARASLGEAQDRHGDGPGHAGEGDDDGAPGMRSRSDQIQSTHVAEPKYSIPFAMSCITNRKFVGNVSHTQIRRSHESKEQGHALSAHEGAAWVNGEDRFIYCKSFQLLYSHLTCTFIFLYGVYG